MYANNCVYTCLLIPICAKNYLYNHFYLYSTELEFLCMSPTLIHYHMDHIDFLYLSLTTQSNIKKSGSHHLPYIIIIIQSSIHLQHYYNVSLYLWGGGGKLSTKVLFLRIFPFAFSFTDCTYFQNNSDQHHFIHLLQ